jgi:TatD DNase family protein
LPMIIHTRDARDATFDFIRDNDVWVAVMHCYSEDIEFAEQLMELSDDIMFSFSWILTYKNASKVQEAAQKIPLERIMIETDSPFLAPQPVRWTINNPTNVVYVLDKLIELRTEWRELIQRAVYENGRNFYKI